MCKKNLKTCSVICVLLVALIGMCTSTRADPPGWIITQLTDNNDRDDDFPAISGSNVAWEGEDGTDYEIFFYDGTTVTQITDNNERDYEPKVSGSNVVWEGFDGTDWQIFLYDGTSITQITNNDEDDWGPQVSGSNVVWTGDDGTDDEIFFYDGTTITQLTDNTQDDRSPQVSGSNVVWESHDGTDYEIFFYDGTTITQLTDNTQNDRSPRLSGSNVVWESYDGTDWEIFFYDGTTITQLTDNTQDDRSPRVSGSNVVWDSYDGTDWEIFFYDGSAITQITDNNDTDCDPEISGSNVVWHGDDGTDWEIFFYDGTAITQITDNNDDDEFPQVSGSNVVWEAYDGADWEVFMAVPMAPTVSTCFAVNELKIDAKRGRRGGKVEIKATFSTAVPIDLMTDDVTCVVYDDQLDMCSYFIPAGRFEVDGKPEKQRFKFDSGPRRGPRIKAKFDLLKCNFELKAEPDPDAARLTDPNLTVVLQVGTVMAEDLVQVSPKSKGKRLEYKRKPKFDCCDRPPVGCGPCKGKVTELRLRNNGPDALVEVYEGKKAKADDKVFEGAVLHNQEFAFDGVGVGKDDTLGTEISIYVDGLFHTKIHTSCSKPIGPGLVSGDFEVVSGESKDGGPLCPIPPPPPCGCKGKVTVLTLKYYGPDALVQVYEGKKAKADEMVFEGNVVNCAEFTVSGAGVGKDETLGTDISIYVDGLFHTKIHTSCSKPIGPGLVSGDFKVISGESKDGGPLCPVPPPPPPPPPPPCGPCKGKVTELTLRNNGPDALVQVYEGKKAKADEIVFEGAVLQNQEFAFDGAGVGKDDTLGTDISIYVDGLFHTKIHTSCSKPIGPGLVSGDFEVVSGKSKDGGPLCPLIPPPPPPGADYCDDHKKPKALTMRYTATDCTASNHAQGKKASCEDFAVLPNTVYIVAQQDKKDDRIWFAGTVNLGDMFDIDAANAGKKKLDGSSVMVNIYDNVSDTLLQQMEIHTSCSQPLRNGDQFGSLVLVGFVPADK